MHIHVQAAYHGIPIVGMPLFGEQPDNVARAVEKGWGLGFTVHPLPQLAHTLERSLRRVLQEPTFAEQAVAVSKLMRAKRWSPAEVAASKLLQNSSAYLVCSLSANPANPVVL